MSGKDIYAGLNIKVKVVKSDIMWQFQTKSAAIHMYATLSSVIL